MKLSQVLFPAAVVAFGFFATTGDVAATPGMGRKEKTACVTCHKTAAPKKGSPDLNSVGDCYKKMPVMAMCKK